MTLRSTKQLHFFKQPGLVPQVKPLLPSCALDLVCALRAKPSREGQQQGDGFSKHLKLFSA